MEGDFIKLNEWLLPLSWIYRLGVNIRNTLFEIGILKSCSFDTPVISVGNITVGGTGKTPHVEYLIKLLQDNFHVAVLSRGYKRKSKGFVIADEQTKMGEIGDEPFQMHLKFPQATIAVDKDRCRGINRLEQRTEDNSIDVILLDDAFQHRYVKPGINILLVDYHRLIIYDKLLPVGCMREPLSGKNRADIVIITKCPTDLKPMEFRVITKAMDLYPYQQLFFTTLEYEPLKSVLSTRQYPLEAIQANENILLLTGIASPKQMIVDLKPHTEHIHPLTFGDHHNFTAADAEKINTAFAALPQPKRIITTEKDAVRLRNLDTLSEEVQQNLYVLPIHIKFMLDQEEIFNEKIIGYVRKNSRNSILVKRKDDYKSHNSNNSGNRPRTISFRNH